MGSRAAFLFPGQGSQSVGMGGELFAQFPVAKKTLEEADRALGISLSDLIAKGPEEKLTETANAQPAILTLSVAAGRILLEKGIKPVIMAGHSLGEYSALVLAGVLPFSDAVKLVRKRGEYMQQAVPLGVGTMSAILGMDDAVVEEVCELISKKGLVVEPANYNCPGQLVISGTQEGVAAAVEELKNRGAKRCVPLQVSAPFHCSLLKPAGTRLGEDLAKVSLSTPTIPYIANVDSNVVRTADGILHRLTEQVWKPVRWTQSLQKILQEFKPDCVVEVGPGRIVSGHVKKIDRAIPCYATDTAKAISDIPR